MPDEKKTGPLTPAPQATPPPAVNPTLATSASAPTLATAPRPTIPPRPVTAMPVRSRCPGLRRIVDPNGPGEELRNEGFYGKVECRRPENLKIVGPSSPEKDRAPSPGRLRPPVSPRPASPGRDGP